LEGKEGEKVKRRKGEEEVKRKKEFSRQFPCKNFRG